MRAEVPYDQREGSEAKTSHHRGLESPIAFAQQYGDVFAEDQIGFAVPVEVADGH